LKGFQSSKPDSFFRAEPPFHPCAIKGEIGGCFIAHCDSLPSMIELLGNPEMVEDALEAVGNKTEQWTDRWWWKPLRFLTYVLPFAGVGVYYYWFL
jgi:hypothetical protein